MKSRILYIATFPPPIHGSAVVSMQIKNSSIINEEFDGDYVNLATTRAMNEPNNYFLKLIRTVNSLFRTLWLLIIHRYDLCYCAITISSACFLRDAPYVLLCKLFRRKIVIHQHNVGMSKLIDKPIYRWLFPLVYKNAKVILLSWHLYPDIEKVVKKEDVLICHNGIKPSLFSFDRLDIEKNHGPLITNIFFLSNLLIDKGVLVLLDSLALLKDKGLLFNCDVVGSETYEIDRNGFELQVKQRGLENYVHYHGRKYGTEKDIFWKRADVFVLPSFGEAFPLVTLEAMEQGVPVVATRVGGIPDQIEENKNGFLVPPRDSVSLAKAIEPFIGNKPLSIQMGLSGREKYEKMFTESIFEQTMSECLKKCIL